MLASVAEARYDSGPGIAVDPEIQYQQLRMTQVHWRGGGQMRVRASAGGCRCRPRRSHSSSGRFGSQLRWGDI
jgi:hypothetical protein